MGAAAYPPEATCGDTKGIEKSSPRLRVRQTLRVRGAAPLLFITWDGFRFEALPLVQTRRREPQGKQCTCAHRERSH